MAGDLVRFGICPNGYRVTIPIILAIIAFAATLYSSFSCNFFQTDTGVLSGPIDGRFGNTTEFGMGIWLIEEVDDNGETGSCVTWDRNDESLDVYLKTARSSSFITMACAAFFSICFTLISLWRFNEPLLKIFYQCSCLSFWTMGSLMVLTLIALLSDYCGDAEDCTLARAGYAACIACAFWMSSGCLLCCCTPVNHRKRKEKEAKKQTDDEDNDDEEESSVVDVDDYPDTYSTTHIETEQKTEFDGTIVKMITTTTTHRNGKKSVSQEREVVQRAPPVPPPKKEEEEEEEEETKSVTFVETGEKTESDGTVIKITKTTVTHRNGRKTITQNREVLRKPEPIPAPKEEKKEEEPTPVPVAPPRDDSHRATEDPPSRSEIIRDRDMSFKVQETSSGLCGAFCT